MQFPHNAIARPTAAVHSPSYRVQLRSMVSDWSDGKAPSEDYKVYKRAQGRVEAKAAPRRVVGPSSTQLQLVRAMVRAIYDENSELRQST